MNNNKELSLAEIQQGSYEILKVIKKIFEENNLHYYLMYGTLIGAARHKGFIPWDDDIDIWIPRPDYEKFIDYCIKHKKELYPLELLHYKTNDKYIYPIARMSDSRYSINYDNAKEYGLGLFVDLYPVDGFKANDKRQFRKMICLNRFISICGSNYMVKSNNKIKNILKIPYYHIVKHFNLKKLLIKADILAQKYSYNDSEDVACMCWLDALDMFRSYNKTEIEGDVKIKFNDEDFSVPHNYDKVLRKRYGDYMKLPPKEARVGHHFYRAYKKK